MARSRRGWRVVWTILICAPVVAIGIWAAIASFKDEDAQTADSPRQPISASSAPADSRSATLASQKVNSTSRPRKAPVQETGLGNGSLLSPEGGAPSALDLGAPLSVPSPDDLSIGVQPAKP